MLLLPRSALKGTPDHLLSAPTSQIQNTVGAKGQDNKLYVSRDPVLNVLR